MKTMTSRTSYTFLGSALLLSLALGLPATSPPVPKSQKKGGQKSAPKPLDGKAIFAQKCAACHGPKGEGGGGYSKPLIGSRSVAELSKFISKTMPPDPKPCSVPEAEKVAAFMHESFYSPLAQERNRPARVTLSRLTVTQFKNAVADLVGNYHDVVPPGEPIGLKAEYYRGGDLQYNAKAFEKVDPEVKFDFGTNAPALPTNTPAPKDGPIGPHSFSMGWQGSVVAPDSGEYELIVRTDQSTRLWMNNERAPVIDAWIKSGKDSEFKATVNLLGGRAYPILLQFSKATQGVVDPKKKETKPPAPAFIELQWRRPHRAVETIPTRFLYNQGAPKTFVVSTQFPPDDRSIGYERGNTVSKAWDDATTSAAIEAATYVSENLNSLVGISDDAKDRKDRLKAYCRNFVERAFRRPTPKDVEQLYIDRQFETAPSAEEAVKRVVMLTLKSPRFLYRELGTGPKDGYTLASELSFGLWDSLPDPQVLRVAASGGLVQREQFAQQAERMVNSPRAWNKLREFLLAWLKVDEVPEIVKSDKKYPEFDAITASDLRSSFELFLEKNAWGPNSDYRDLLTSQTQFLNGRLAKVYGVSLPANAPFQPVALDAQQRAGVLTHPYILSRFAYLEASSPIHRGVLIARSLLGRTLRPPPAAFAPLAPSLHPSLTTRERVAMQTKPDACNTCHNLINPLGFTLEKFDAIGRLRAQDNGKAVDATGSYQSRSGEAVKFSGAVQLSKYLAESDEAHAAFVEKLFQHLVKQPVLAYGPKTLPGLETSFSENRYSIRKLMVQIMVSTGMPPDQKGVVTPTPSKGAK